MKNTLIKTALLLLALVFMAPLVLTLISSLMSGTELQSIYEDHEVLLRLIPMRVVFSNYFDVLLSDTAYLSMFWNSVFLASAIMLGNLAVALAVGYVLAKPRFRGREGMRFIYIVMMMMPFQVTLLPNYIVLKKMNLYNTLWALILPGVFAPMGVFLLSQFMRGMPDETVEAAMLETNSAFAIFLKVIMPAISPGILALALLSFSESWSMVEQPLILLADKGLYPLSMVFNNVAIQDLGIAFAGAVLYVVPVILLYNIFADELIKGISVMKF